MSAHAPSLRTVLCLLLASAVAIAADPQGPPPSAEASESGLRRRASLGFSVSALGERVRDAMGLRSGRGVVVNTVLPGSPAERAGLREGDLIRSVDFTDLRGLDDFLRATARRRVGDELHLGFVRDGQERRTTIVLGELAREQADDFAVSYDAVEVDGERWRTIVTRPPGPGPHPAVLLVPDDPCASLDLPFDEAAPPRALLAALTRAGYATMRLEPRGVGDSEGARCDGLDEAVRLAGFTAALDALRAYDFVADDAVFLVAEDGGELSGALARSGAVRGVVPAQGAAEALAAPR